ncbi:MAG TPA: glucosamine-6-phosphate deaminase [Pirellulaceae bacterium]|nr:glucosamine-6-phosphate deaminase [Pirellulaceae bacterium]HMO93075.1 glucosamine-6-phosphate deaminase [Pirellulaceae bacterium]HMP69974.1 glucosamine-6-phosphate deaminase [Pirellulaceae bacterium]
MAATVTDVTSTDNSQVSIRVTRNAFEKIDCQVFEHARDLSLAVAEHIANAIRAKAQSNKKCILGLATGSSPVGVYDQLVRMHREEGLSFANVVTFNLDEYYPMRPQELQSYVRFMDEHLFDHIDIPRENVHIPDGTIGLKEVQDYCTEYERKIKLAGGIDIQLLGIGRTGHIGFNEPGSSKSSVTRLITLDKVTRKDAAADFFGEENVPRRAITMGVGTILEAHEILIIALGEHKAQIVKQAVEGEITSSVSASFLQEHPNAKFLMDKAAGDLLTRHQCPWLLGPIDWDSYLTRKAVIWLSQLTRKPILKLLDEDYNEHGLQDLLAESGSAYDINIGVFRYLQTTITGWPGGKPSGLKRPGDVSRPHDDIFPKRILAFSPHPDDDVISMGGTLIRLVDQGHEVHVAYQTSGNIAVFDDDAIRFCEFVADFNKEMKIDMERTQQMEEHIEKFLKNKQAGEVDSPEVQTIKGMIRRGEARAAARLCRIPESRLHFMDLPFYETGKVKKKPLGEEDVQMTVDLLRRIQPHQIYAAGDLRDPHGTHRVCLSAIIQACRRVEQDEWYKNCVVWLYRGAWQEWDPHEIEMAVPLSPNEVLLKRAAIFKHQSQKDRALYPGHDQREFWQRAEDRNAMTARLYDELGLAEYQAIEGFVRWKGDKVFD